MAHSQEQQAGIHRCLHSTHVSIIHCVYHILCIYVSSANVHHTKKLYVIILSSPSMHFHHLAFRVCHHDQRRQVNGDRPHEAIFFVERRMPGCCAEGCRFNTVWGCQLIWRIAGLRIWSHWEFPALRELHEALH